MSRRSSGEGAALFEGGTWDSGPWARVMWLIPCHTIDSMLVCSKIKNHHWLAALSTVTHSSGPPPLSQHGCSSLAVNTYIKPKNSQLTKVKKLGTYLFTVLTRTAVLSSCAMRAPHDIIQNIGARLFKNLSIPPTMMYKKNWEVRIIWFKRVGKNSHLLLECKSLAQWINHLFHHGNV